MHASSDREDHQVANSAAGHIIACVIRWGKDKMVMVWDSEAGRLKWSDKGVFEDGTQDEPMEIRSWSMFFIASRGFDVLKSRQERER
jgi:hypothetical protein